MKLNLDFYKEDVIYNPIKNEEYIIENYINKIEENDYLDAINKEVTINNIYALSDIRKNIISWYPFEKNSTILEIGSGLGEITGVLCDKAKEVTSVEFSLQRGEALKNRHNSRENLEVIIGKLEDIQFSKKFDYIVMIGIFEYIPSIYKTENSYKDFLNYIKSLLNKDGKILMATSNKYGMRVWSTIDDNPQSLAYDIFNRNPDLNENRLFSKRELENLFDEVNIGNRRYYYPLPDYKYTNIIYTDKYLPKKGSLHRNISLFEDTDIINFNENNGYLKILEDNPEMFGFFANSYFIEISNNLIDNDIKFVSYWNNRNSKYRLQTMMKSEYVYKEATNNFANNHIQTMKKNIDILNKIGINTLDSYEENIIQSKIVDYKSYDEVILTEAKLENNDRVIELIKKFYDEIIGKLKETGNEENIFDVLEIEYNKEDIEGLHFIKDGLWDLNFQNAFIDGEKIYIYDQEWYLENIPKEFILYRGILTFRQLHEAIDIDIIYDYFGLTKYIDLFNKLEKCISSGIMYEHINTLWNKPCKNIRGMLKKEADDENLLNKKDVEINDLKYELQKSCDTIQKLTNSLKVIENSASWKVTKPMRYISKKLKGV